MPRIIDLTMPVAKHVRWPVERKLLGDLAKGDNFQITWFGMAAHAFTHIDAPRHVDPNGLTLSDVGLEKVVGEAVVVDLTDVAPDTGITPEHLEASGAEVEPDDIVLLKTNWDAHTPYDTIEYFTDSPYVTREACHWLLGKQIRAIGYDFPQDRALREMMAGKSPPITEFVTHDILLRAGIIMIEYLCNMKPIESPRVDLFALPMKISDSDGAPARVIALENP